MPRKASVKPKVTIKTTGDALFKEFAKTFKTIKGSWVEIGVLQASRQYPPDPHNPKGPRVTLGQVAAWQEFGTHTQDGAPIAPARSFIRAPMDKGKKGIERLKKRQVDMLSRGLTTVEGVLKAIGFDATRRMQNAILRRIPPPLKPSTLAKRTPAQGTIPLYKTKFLWKALGFKVYLKKK